MHIGDTLLNLVSGLGVWGKDKAAHRAFALRVMARDEVEAAYRTDWIARKIIDRPAFDMTRAWRTVQIDKAKLTKFADEERRLGVRQKFHRALVLGRLYGGSGLVMDDGAADLMQPLKVTGIGGLKALIVVPRHRLTAGPIDWDVYSPTFNEPTHFNLHGGQRGSVEVHPSRVITFTGSPIPESEAGGTAEDRVYGDSVLMAVRDAVMDAASTNQNISALVEEAKVDVVKIKGLLGAIMSKEYRDQLLQRWELAAVLKSIHNVMLLDGNEEWERKQTSFAGLTDIAKLMLQTASAAADMPATIFLSQSPSGLNSTGDSDLQNYDQFISARQETDLTPRLDRLDDALYVSALGAKPEGAYSQWNPLRIPTRKEAAEIETAEATAARTIADSGLVPIAALEVSFQNRLIESGRWPGLEQAIEDAKAGVLLPFEDPADEGNDIDPKTGEPYPEGDPRSPVTKAANENEPREITVNGGKVAIKAGARKPTRDSIITDAKPRSLYVSRRLLNAEQFIAWAKAQGFGETLTADQLHVTVAFSRAPIDWLKVPSDWWQDANGEVTVPAGGARMVEPLGDKGAVVLLFASDYLSHRHTSIVGAGASWDWDDYQPHVTISYQMPEGMDLSKVEPFRGKLRFGPEIFEEVVEDWEKAVVEA